MAISVMGSMDKGCDLMDYGEEINVILEGQTRLMKKRGLTEIRSLVAK